MISLVDFANSLGCSLYNRPMLLDSDVVSVSYMTSVTSGKYCILSILVS